ncbi:dynein heavy chain domain-containing protein 1 [Amblyraja radiata]|uniref:dynein heavy chain domain-containing protein 1 n=1 Tax=Amblyraja radiata TaxID=386614 RepID=UPI0014027485|nr:dynein heavy chain domain-containing protein 1 [Amblyraja radiata]
MFLFGTYTGVRDSYSRGTAEYHRRLESLLALVQVVRQEFLQHTSYRDKEEEQVEYLWNNFLQACDEATEFIRNQRDSVLDAIWQEREMLTARVLAIQADVNDARFQDPQQNAAAMLQELLKMREELQAAMQSMEALNNTQDAIKGEPFDLTFVAATELQVNSRRELWNVYYTAFLEVKDWKRTLLSQFKLQQVRLELDGWLAIVEQLRAHIPADDGVLLAFFEVVSVFRRFLPILADMCQPEMKERHWRAIFTEMGEAWNAMWPITIGDLLVYNLPAYSEFISQVLAKARKEWEVHKLMVSVERFWKSFEFRLVTHIAMVRAVETHPHRSFRSRPHRVHPRTVSWTAKDSGTLKLIEIGQLQWHVDDSMMTLSSIMSSAAPIDDQLKAGKLKEMIEHFGELLDLWKNFQDRWVFLHQISSEMVLKARKVDLTLVSVHGREPDSECQPLLEAVRHSLTCHGTYERDGLRFLSFHSARLSLVASCAPGPDQSGLSGRLLRLLTVLAMPAVSWGWVATVYTPGVLGWLRSFPTYTLSRHSLFARALVFATVELYQRVKERFPPSPPHPHYLLSVADIGKVLRGLQLMPPAAVGPGKVGQPVVTVAKTVVALWLHECMRTFSDRLVCEQHRTALCSALHAVAHTHFSSHTQQLSSYKVLLRSTVEPQPAGSPTAGPAPSQELARLQRAMAGMSEAAGAGGSPSPRDSETQPASGLRRTRQSHWQSTKPLLPLHELYSGEELGDLIFSKGAVRPDNRQQLKSPRWNPYRQLTLGNLALQLRDVVQAHNQARRSSRQLIFFKEAVQHLARLSRLLLTPGAHGALLAAAHCSGRGTLIRLAAYLARAAVFHLSGRESGPQVAAIFKRASRQAGLLERCTVIVVPPAVPQQTLQRLFNITTDGTYPDLYSAKEFSRVAKEFAATRNLAWNLKQEQVLERYLLAVRQSLHVVLLLPLQSAAGAGSVAWAPGGLTHLLGPAGYIDVWHQWNHQAYAVIATSHLGIGNLSTVRTTGQSVARIWVLVPIIVKIMALIHQSALSGAAHMAPTLPLITPRHYLDFIDLFSMIFHYLEQSEGIQINRMELGLDKIREVYKAAEERQQEIERLRHKLELLGEEIRLLQELYAKLRSEFQELLQRMRDEEFQLALLQREMDAARQAFQREYGTGKPLYETALQALLALSSSDLDEVRTYRAPPLPVVTVMNTICLMFGKMEGWENVKLLISQDNFFQELQFYDKDNIPEDVFRALGDIILRPEFQPETVREASRAVESFSVWVRAVYYHAVLAREYSPTFINRFQELIEQAQTRLGLLRKLAERMRKGLLEVLREDMDDNLSDSDSLLEASDAELLRLLLLREQELVRRLREQEQELLAQLRRVRQELRRNEELIQALRPHRSDWDAALEQSKGRRRTMSGDALLTAAAVVYLGPFEERLRQELLDKWKGACHTGTIRMEPVDPRQELLDILASRAASALASPRVPGPTRDTAPPPGRTTSPPRVQPEAPAPPIVQTVASTPSSARTSQQSPAPARTPSPARSPTLQRTAAPTPPPSPALTLSLARRQPLPRGRSRSRSRDPASRRRSSQSPARISQRLQSRARIATRTPPPSPALTLSSDRSQPSPRGRSRKPSSRRSLSPSLPRSRSPSLSRSRTPPTSRRMSRSLSQSSSRSPQLVPTPPLLPDPLLVPESAPSPGAVYGPSDFIPTRSNFLLLDMLSSLREQLDWNLEKLPVNATARVSILITQILLRYSPTPWILLVDPDKQAGIWMGVLQAGGGLRLQREVLAAVSAAGSDVLVKSASQRVLAADGEADEASGDIFIDSLAVEGGDVEWVPQALEERPSHDLWVCPITKPDLEQLLLTAAVNGMAVLVTDIELRPFPPVLSRLLLAGSGTTEPGAWERTFETLPVKIKPGFRVYLSTSLPLKKFESELEPALLKRMRCVDLTISESGLQELILKEVLYFERQRVDGQLARQVDIMYLQHQLHVAQEELMDKVVQTATSLLHDRTIREDALESHKTQVELRSTLQALGPSPSQAAAAADAPYMVISNIGSQMYWALLHICRLNAFYYFSKTGFMKVVRVTLSRRKQQVRPRPPGAGTGRDHHMDITDYLISSIYGHYRWCLLVGHARLYRFLVVVGHMKALGQLTALEWELFLRGTDGMDLDASQPDSGPLPPTWVEPAVWRSCAVLELLPAFRHLRHSLLHHAGHWREYFRLTSTVIGPAPGPGPGPGTLSVFQRAILWRLFRPSLLDAVMNDLVSSDLGGTLLRDLRLTVPALYRYSRPTVPVLFLTPAGSAATLSTHPLYWIRQMATEHQLQNKISIISLGAGDQTDEILEALLMATQKGHWLVLDNCHLLDRWDERLVSLFIQLVSAREAYALPEATPRSASAPDYVCEDVKEPVLTFFMESGERVHGDFRLWLICRNEDDCSMPGVIRRFTEKLVIETHSLLQNTLKRTYTQAQGVSRDRVAAAPLAALSALHSVLLHRQQFRHWTQARTYRWTESDLFAALDIQRNLRASWGDAESLLEHFVDVAVYRGHLQDTGDEAALSSVLHYCLRSSCGGGSSNGIANLITRLTCSTGDVTAADIDGRIELMVNRTETAAVGIGDGLRERLQEARSQMASRALARSQSSGARVEVEVDVDAPGVVQLVGDGLEQLSGAGASDVHAPGSAHPLRRFVELERRDLRLRLERRACALRHAVDALRSAQPCLPGTRPLCTALELGRVPVSWWRGARRPPPFALWLQRVTATARLLDGYVRAPAACYNLSAFHRPQLLVLALRQARARDDQRALGTYRVRAQVLSSFLPPHCPPDEGVYISGLVLHGALWDSRLGVLQDTMSIKSCSLPAVWMRAVEAENADTPSLYPQYECPVYLGAESGVGDLTDTNIILHISLASKLDPMVCAQRRVHIASSL